MAVRVAFATSQRCLICKAAHRLKYAWKGEKWSPQSAAANQDATEVGEFYLHHHKRAKFQLKASPSSPLTSQHALWVAASGCEFGAEDHLAKLGFGSHLRQLCGEFQGDALGLGWWRIHCEDSGSDGPRRGGESEGIVHIPCESMPRDRSFTRFHHFHRYATHGLIFYSS